MRAEGLVAGPYSSDGIGTRTLELLESAPRYNRWIYRRLAPFLGRRVLEFGCGRGAITQFLVGRDEVVALDAAPDLVATARKRLGGKHNLRILQGELGDGVDHLNGQRFDSAVSVNVFEHLDDDLGAMRAIWSLLEPGGRLAVLVPGHPALLSAFDRAIGHRRRYTKPELAGKLRRAGFEVEMVRRSNPVGALAWLLTCRLLGLGSLVGVPLFDRLVPLLAAGDRLLEPPFGLSLIAVARKGEAVAPLALPEPGRLLFLDLLRAVAVLFMVETHVFNALLRSDLKQGAAFALVNFVNGLVAPAFLFLAGFNFVLSGGRHREQPAGVGWAWRQLQRLAGLLLVGYALHLPFFSLARTVRDSDQPRLAAFLQADVLQAIASSLLVLLLLLVLLRNLGRLGWLALLLAAAVALATPAVWAADLPRWLPLPLATYLTPRDGSPFPFFPWAGFVFAGAAAGERLLRARASDDERRTKATIANFFVAGAFLVLAGPVLDSHIVDLYPRSDLPLESPGFFGVRLGLVLVALSLVALRTLEIPRPAPGLRWLQVIGQESLLVYCLGLILLYGWVLDVPHLARVLGPTLTLAQTGGVFASLALAAVLAATAWHWLKEHHRQASLLGRYAAFAAFLSLLVLRPY